MTQTGLFNFVFTSYKEVNADIATATVTGSLTTAQYSTKGLFTFASFDVKIAIIATMSVLNKEHKVKVATGAVIGSLSTAQYSTKGSFNLVKLAMKIARRDTVTALVLVHLWDVT